MVFDLYASGTYSRADQRAVRLLTRLVPNPTVTTGRSNRASPTTSRRRSRTSVGRLSGPRFVVVNSIRTPRSDGGGTGKTRSTSSGLPRTPTESCSRNVSGRTSRSAPALVSQLRERAERVRWGSDARNEEFALFSKSGFVDGLADDVDDNWSLFGLRELEDVL